MGLGKSIKSYLEDYPKHVFFILGNELCERFSYYGMKAILVLFLNRALNYDDNTSTAIYHGFNFTAYFMPLFGALIADGLLGKFKTILWISIIYCVGNIVMAVGAIPFNGTYYNWIAFIGLGLIAIGTGGIKPCVSSFGGDQFQEHQTNQKNSFFAVFYMSINIGSLMSMIITPILRSEVYCFGDNCYFAAFGIPAILMIVAVFFFVFGSKYYTKIPAGENIIGKMFGCIVKAISMRCGSKEKKDHWLEYADSHYDKTFIDDLKCVLGVMFMFLPLPVFWALYDQQGSRWTLQAGQMNGDFGGFIMQPDMMQVFNAALIIALVPTIETLVFPCLNKLHIPNSPLQRLGFGMFLAGLSFVLAAVLQIGIDNELPSQVDSGMTRVRLINAAPCDSTVLTMINNNNKELSANNKGMSAPLDISPGNHTMHIHFPNCVGARNQTAEVTLKAGKAYNLMAYKINTAWGIKEIELFKTDRTMKGKSSARFINTLPWTVDIKLTASKGEISGRMQKNVTSLGTSGAEEIEHQRYDASIVRIHEQLNITDDLKLGHVDSKNGAVYSLVIQLDKDTNEPTMVVHTQVTSNTVNIFWQVPQYFVMSVGEVFFSVTGLSFAYSQAPPSMKAILQAAWLMTNAFGNLIVVIISQVGKLPSQTAEFFLFAGIMFVTVIIYIPMSLMFKYKEEIEEESPDEKIAVDNKGFNVVDEKPTAYGSITKKEITDVTYL